jgi:hypothetical protein
MNRDLVGLCEAILAGDLTAITSRTPTRPKECDRTC